MSMWFKDADSLVSTESYSTPIAFYKHLFWKKYMIILTGDFGLTNGR